MIFAKTVGKNNPGAYIHVVPVGLLARVQYNKNGLVEKILLGYGDNAPDVNNAAFKQLINFVPNTIPLSGGTTWVDGVFYSNEISTASGNLPECTYGDYIDKATSGAMFSFYAGHVESLAASFGGALSCRNWLSIAKFNLLPGIVVPIEMSESTMEMMLKTRNYNFQYPYIAGFMLYNSNSYEYVSAELHQAIVKTVSKYATEIGYIKAKLTTDVGVLNVDYSDVVSNSIQTNTSILYYEGDQVEIAASRKTDTKTRDAVSNTITCDFCKKTLAVPAKGAMMCDDPHCLSHSYPDVRHMLSVLNLPELSYKDYTAFVKSGEVLTTTDVLLLPQYKDADVSASLSDIVKSATPVDVCASDAFFENFVQQCNNSVETIMYYAQNPLRAQTDLDFDSVIGQRFARWLSDSYNVLTLQTMLSYVTVSTRVKLSDGAPIFRGRTFALTGRFIRGSYAYMTDVIISLAGSVMNNPSESNLPDCVVMGGTQENLDGSLIRLARDNNLSLMTEDQFFRIVEAL